MNAVPPDGEGRDLDAEALSRVLDGLELEADADDAERAAHSRAEDDVAAIMRAFAVMGDALAEPTAAAAAAAASPVAEDEGDHDAVVIPFATRLKQRMPILAAAASLLVVVGLGTVLVNNDNFSGGRDEDSATAQGADSAAVAPAAPPVPNAAMERNAAPAYDSANPLLSGESGSAAAPAAKSAAGTAADAEEERAADSASTTSSKADKKAASRPALDVAVSCNRGVFIGRVLSVTPSGDRYTLRVTVTDWISPNSGAAVREFTVGRSYANTEDGRIDLKLGQEWLFVVPQSLDKAVRAFAGPDYAKARDQVAAAQERTADDAC